MIGDGVHHLMKDRFGVDKNDATKDVIWDLHQSDNKALPENKEVLYMVIDRYDAGTDMRSAAGLEIKRQLVPWFPASNQISTPAGEQGFADNDEKKNPYLLEYGRGICTLRSTWYHQYSIWTLDDTDLRHKAGNWVHVRDLKYNNLTLKGKSDWYGKNVQLYNDKGDILVKDTIRCWSSWPHYKSNVADQKANWWRGGWADWYVFRLAETYLLRAEAYTWLDKKDLAAADINEVRRRAGARDLDASEVSISQILDERARELFYEEPRKTELTRIAYLFAKTGKADEKGRTCSMTNFTENNYFYNRIMDRTEFYNQGVKNGVGNSYTIAPYNVLWPIAEKAISTNVEGHINQTPGYAGSENNIEPMDTPNK
ncbi:MAG: RagB/SusD family nutrient uptake outer membrane protein [Bacteroides sp.]|nr:RagB/SusD family nutrient uptake outer membrane protein [Bacteroides sp.]